MLSAIPRLCCSLACALVFCSTALHAQAQQPAAGTGRIAGAVIDAETGRPVPGATVEVIGTTVRLGTDVEGRYRTPPIPAGAHAVQVTMIGYATSRVDSVLVRTGEATPLQVALKAQAIAVDAVTVTVTGQRQASAAGLLAVQKNSPAVMDGISAQQMARSPDSDAADAIARVTGIAIVDDKFVVARGLTERYSNTTLNGVELASPEPTRRVVPLDIFPSSLLESIVVTKTATPDISGDFAGGSVNVQTKDFPEERVLELKVSQGWSSLSTFKNLPVLGRNGIGDMTGFDGADRFRGPLDNMQALAKSSRTVWTPTARAVRPDLGISAQYGDQLGAFERAFGYVISFDYGFKTSYEPAEYFAVADPSGTTPVANTTEHATTTADWGLLGNATLRLGSSHTFGIKNLITQESEEFVIINQAALNTFPEGGYGDYMQRFQVRYLERGFRQSQLRGQHRFSWPFGTTWNWNVTVSQAKRDEPENRSLTYVDDQGLFRLEASRNNYYWFRFMDDRIYGANVDLSIPLGWWPGDAQALFKTGVSGRRKNRTFDASRFSLVPVEDPPDGVESIALPPDLVVAPENVGRNLRVKTGLSGGLPYTADDEVRAAYVMADLPLFFGLRAVGGVRMEQWLLDVHNAEVPFGFDSVSVRNNQDLLWSANLTLPLSEQMNLRAAGYRTVSRPDPREIAIGSYSPVGGKCIQAGFAGLKRAQILNGDLRWEWYPNPGELVSISGFYKLFTDAIVEVVSVVSNDCGVNPSNARTAYAAGGEFELRKGLGFFGSALSNFSLGVNFTYSIGQADLVLGNTGVFKLDLQDLSKYLGNGSIAYNNVEAGFSATVLYNYFADRVSLYGQALDVNLRAPDVVEKGRGTVDAKVSKRLGKFTASLSGKNLTDQFVQETQMTDLGPLLTGFARPGVSLSLSLGYVF